ncbi:putative enoyl-CoA hydratase, mitochondrial [Vanrija pseudolonga]|uniref:Probable enoyl-CoA hydratase, mitochondrial n=1 Tax=Vanrija pseudolonga TaxID=143232 RepID=A0AAF0Y8C0_9TREE|nr:putative enoyl-CoA hydratase, mitochondrial [Vanrija pseudolonga]
MLVTLRPTVAARTAFQSYVRAMSTQAEPLVLSRRSDSGKVQILTLNRPKALNALSTPLFDVLNVELEKADADPEVRAIVLTGGDKVFAAGADIKEMKDKTFSEAYSTNFLGSWAKLATIKKPIVGAVAGYALGGGCELALMTDILVASEKATFGQPEITLGIIPGGGGTQRLVKTIGKARAMDLTLTNRKITGKEAYDWGLAARLVPADQSVTEEAVKIAEGIAGFGALAAQAGKEAVNAAGELPLSEGLRFERRLFQALFATADQKEGMAAFAEKRKPTWKHE